MAASISVTCPDCETRFKVLVSAAGKKVRCPDCGTPVKVREGPPSDGRRSDRGDEDDRNERPRRKDHANRSAGRPAGAKARHGKQRGLSPVLWFALGLGALVLLGGTATLIYVLTKKDKDTGSSAAGSDTSGGPSAWKEVGDAESGFRILMPGAPGRQVRPGNVRGAVGQPVRWSSITGDGTHRFTVLVIDFGQRELPTDAAGLRRLLEESDSTALWGQKIMSQREVQVGGRSGAELELAQEDPEFGDNEHMVMRLVTANGKFYTLVLGAPHGKFDAKIRSLFFDSFHLR